MGKTNEVYSWGMGENYVLGNRDDRNEFTPYLLDPRMFENNKVIMMACGTQHCVALTKDSPESADLQLDPTKFVVEQVAEKTNDVTVNKPQSPAKVNGDHVAVAVDEEAQSQTSKKRSRADFEDAHAAGENGQVEPEAKKLRTEETPLEPIKEAEPNAEIQPEQPLE